jgi:hypothetical protein
MYNILYIGHAPHASKIVEALQEYVQKSKVYFFPMMARDMPYLKRFLKQYGEGIALIIGDNTCIKIAVDVADEFKAPCFLLDPYIDDTVFALDDEGRFNPGYALFALFTKTRKDIWLRESNKVKKYIKLSNIDYARNDTHMIKLITKVCENYLIKHLPEADAFK